MRSDLQRIVDHLNKRKIRATYSAVADALGVMPQSMGPLLGTRRPEASWIVNKETGEPTGYHESELHPELRSKSEILSSAIELLRSMLDLRRQAPGASEPS